MMHRLIESSLRLRFIVLIAAVALMVVAVTRMGDTPTDLLPEFSRTVIEIQTEALGLSTAEVEQLITVPLEADLLNGVAWLDTIRSESIPSLSSVRLEFLPGTDLMQARHMVQEKLTQAHGLPNVSKPPVMLQPLSSTSRVLNIGLSSDEHSLIDLSVLARWNIRPRLMGVKGVANIAIWGQRKRQLQVLVDPERIQAAGVTLQEIIATTGNALWVSPLTFLDASTPGTGGFIDTPNQRLGVRHVLPIVSPAGLANVVIEGHNRKLGDVVNVVESHQPLIGDAIVGSDSGIMLVVEKFPWANTVQVTHGIEAALEKLMPGLKGVNVDTQIYRPASYIEHGISNLQEAVLIGGGLILITIFLFFMDLRMTLISAASIITSCLLAWFVLFMAGMTMDALLFVGLMIAIGAIVDESIVDVQNIRHRLSEERKAGVTVWQIIASASAEIRTSLGFTTLMLLLLVLPFFYIEGVFGFFMSTIATSYMIAVISSLVVALTLTPVLALLLLPKEPGEVRMSPLSRALLGGYETVAKGLSGAKGPAYIITAISLLVAVISYPMIMSKPLIPEFQETDLLINWNAQPGTSQPEMTRITKSVARELSGIEGVRNVGAHVGRAITSDRVAGISTSELWVSIDSGAEYEDIIEEVKKVTETYPGIDQEVTTYPRERIREVTGAIDDEKVTVRLYGQQTDVLSTEGKKLSNILSNIEGVKEIDLSGSTYEPTIEIKVNLERAKSSGIKPGDVRRAAATLLSGLEVGSLFEDKKVFEVIVWGVPETRSSISDVQNLLIQSPSGIYVRLKDVADVTITPHPIVLKREGVARYVDLEIDVEGRSLSDVAAEAKNIVLSQNFPMEYHAVVLGNYASKATAQMYNLIAIIVAIIGIFLLLQAVFHSWRLALIVLLASPVAPLGGLLLVMFTGADFTLGTFVGLVTVMGLALRIATLLVKHYQRLEHHEGAIFSAELVARGTLDRAVPILASIIITGFVMLSFVLDSGDAGLEVIGPMAGVILAGMLTTLIFALFVLPSLYLALGENATSKADLENLLEGALHT